MIFTAQLTKKFLLFLCVTALTISLLPGKLSASHIAAVNITYEGIDTFQYIVTVRIYRDCRNGNSVQATAAINFGSISCGLNGSKNLTLITGTGAPGTGNFISLPCLGVTTCIWGQADYAVEEFIYQDTITLNSACNDWVISYETLGLRNVNDVLVNPTSQTIFVSAMLNNLDAPANNSPTFNKPPIAIFCVGGNFFFDQGAIEADGDSLVYSLAPAQGNTGSILTYIPPYNFQTPFNVLTPPLSIDPVNGIISFTSDTPAVTSVMCVLIEEYRNNTLIGSIKNDMQVIISDSCLADTLNFAGDTTTATGTHPAISALCLDSLITVFFDNPIQCETVAGDGSDFFVIPPSGQSVDIYAATIPNCNAGLTDTIILHLTDSLRFNGSFYILSAVGTDGNPLLSECGLPLEDTLEVRLRYCVKASVELKNVSVVDNDSIKIVWQTSTENFSVSFFSRYDIYRSNTPSGPYNLIDSTSAISDTIFYDINVNVGSNAYNYAVKLNLNTAFVPPLSDSIQSILLSGNTNPLDTTQLDLSWTPYWGWSNVEYKIMRIGNGGWEELTTTSNTAFSYAKSLLANTYRLKIETHDTGSGSISESNWICTYTPILNDTVVVANDDITTTNQNVSVVINVQSNDITIDCNPLTTIILSGPSNGSANTLNGSSIQYIPDPGFTGTDTITYQVCDNNVPPLCDQAMVIITVTTGVGIDESIAIQNNMVIYPNPSTGVFVLTINNSQYDSYRITNGELTIYDMLGRIMSKSEIVNRTSEIDISDYPAGIYHLQLITDKAIFNKKIVLEK